MKSGNLNFLEPSGPLQACNGTALPLLYQEQIQSRECFYWMLLYKWMCPVCGRISSQILVKIVSQFLSFYFIKLILEVVWRFPEHLIHCSLHQNICEVILFWSEVKWVTLKFLGTKVTCILGWPYTEGIWLYCDYFFCCVSCTVVVLTCFVMCSVCTSMCGCFDNCVGVLVICVLVFTVLFVLFRLCIFILMLLVQGLLPQSGNNNNNNNNNNLSLTVALFSLWRICWEASKYVKWWLQVLHLTLLIRSANNHNLKVIRNKIFSALHSALR
jgi:hypothetical protein